MQVQKACLWELCPVLWLGMAKVDNIDLQVRQTEGRNGLQLPDAYWKQGIGKNIAIHKAVILCFYSDSDLPPSVSNSDHLSSFWKTSKFNQRKQRRRQSSVSEDKL